MDIVNIGKNSIRIKGKNASIVIDPNNSVSKTDAQAIISLKSSSDFSDSKIEGSRINIKGPGEYEVNGIKISTIKSELGIAAKLDVDNVKILVGNGLGLEKIQDKFEDPHVILVKADEPFNYSSLASFEPRVIILYGEFSEEVCKSLGKEGVKASKYSSTADKLPQELEIYLL